MGPLISVAAADDVDLLPNVTARIVGLPEYASQLALAAGLQRAMDLVSNGLDSLRCECGAAMFFFFYNFFQLSIILCNSEIKNSFLFAEELQFPIQIVHSNIGISF